MTQKPLAAIRFPPNDADLLRPATLLSLPVSETDTESGGAHCEAATPARSAIAAWLKQSANRRRKVATVESTASTGQSSPAASTERKRRFVPQLSKIDVFTDAIITGCNGAIHLLAVNARRLVSPQELKLLYAHARGTSPFGVTSAKRNWKLEGWLWLVAAGLTGTCGLALVMGTMHERKSATLDTVPTDHAAASVARPATNPEPSMPKPLPSPIIRASADENQMFTEGVQSAVYEVSPGSGPRGAWLTGAIIEEDNTTTGSHSSHDASRSHAQ